MSHQQFQQQHQQWAELEFVNPPIPVRSFDWRATTRDYEPGDPMGYGATASEAEQALREELAWREWEDAELSRQEREERDERNME